MSWSEVLFSGGVALVSSVIGAWVGGRMVVSATRDQARRDSDDRKQQRVLEREWSRLAEREQIIHGIYAWVPTLLLSGNEMPHGEKVRYRSELARLCITIRLVVDGEDSIRLLKAVDDFRKQCLHRTPQCQPSLEGSSLLAELHALADQCRKRRAELETMEDSAFTKHNPN